MSSFTLHETMFFKENSLPVKVLLRDPEIPFSLHGHDFYEIVVVVSGKGIHLLEQDKTTIARRHGVSVFVLELFMDMQISRIWSSIIYLSGRKLSQCSTPR